MSTKSFTRNIVISDSKAVNRLKNIACTDTTASKVASVVSKHSNIINKHTDPSIIKSIIQSF